MLFTPKTIGEGYVQGQWIESGKKKGQPNSSKQLDQHGVSNNGEKKKGNRENKKTATTAHVFKDINNHCDHCNINYHMKEKCWKLDPVMNPRSCKQEKSKKNSF